MFRDPVCGSLLAKEQVKKNTTINEKTYSFCCFGCYEIFARDPEKYLGRNWWQRLMYRLAESNAREFKGKGPSCHE